MAENENVLLSERDIQTGPVPINSYYTVYGVHLTPSPFTLTLGETYTVYWNDVKYICTAKDGGAVMDDTVYIGNGKGFYLWGNDEPFVIAQNTYGVVLISVDDTDNTESGKHKVAVYYGDLKDEPDPIVLKNPDGENVTYGDYKKIRLTKASGKKVIFSEGEAVEGVRIAPDFANGNHIESVPNGTLAKSVVVQKPEMLLPENIRDGVTVAGVYGTYKIPTEEKAVAADFSAGDMEIAPTKGKLLEKVSVMKPETLLPENIAAGVDVAGVVGTHQGGGGTDMPHMFCVTAGQIRYQGAASSTKQNVSITLPLEATLYSANAYQASAYAGTTTSTKTSDFTSSSMRMTAGVDRTGTGIVLTHDASYANGSKNLARMWSITAVFSLKGIYSKISDDGASMLIYADKTATALVSNVDQPALPCVVDLSDSSITNIPEYAFYNWATGTETEFLLPPTVSTISGYAFNTGAVVDFSRHTFVPTLAMQYYCFNGAKEIRVPSALYDEWIAATYWSNHASITVPV